MNAPLRLDDVSPPVSRHRFSVRDYHRLAETGILHEDSAVELIEGELVKRAPIGSFHQAMVDRLTAVFSRQAGDYLLRVQGPVALGEHSEPGPDIALLRNVPDFFESAHPTAADVLLLIEVSDTTLDYDRKIKLALYAAYGIAEVWIVDIKARRLELHLDPSADGYRKILRPNRSGAVSPSLLPGISVVLGQLFP